MRLYKYNALNQLTRANISRPQGSSVIDYAYDHDGIRIGKTVSGTEITNYVVDKNRPYAQVPSASSGQDWTKNT